MARKNEPGGAAAVLARRIAQGGGAGAGAPNVEDSVLHSLGGMGGIHEIPRERIHRDENQPRKHFDGTKLKELAHSLSIVGQLQPIVVRPHPDPTKPGEYVIKFGERRWRAADLAGLPALRCIIEGAADRLLAAKQWHENELRENLTALEAAGAVQAVMEMEGLDVSGFAERYLLSERQVRRYLQILEAPPCVQAAIIDGRDVEVEAGVTERRKLDLTAAVELMRVHRALLREEQAKAKKPGGEGGHDPRREADAAARATNRAQAVQRKALAENWSRSTWQNYAASVGARVADAVGEQNRTERSGATRSSRLFDATAAQFTVYLRRLDGSTPDALAEARAQVAALLARLDALHEKAARGSSADPV